MNHPTTRTSNLVKLYQRYLNDGDTAELIVSIAERFSLATLERLLISGGPQTRRAAALALGLLGDHRSIELLGPFLRSADRRLRLVVDDALRSITAREGSVATRQLLERVVRCNECSDFQAAIALSTQAIEMLGGTAELYHQRSLAFFQSDSVGRAIEDCMYALKLNGFHYAAMVGLGHCYLQQQDLVQSLFWFRQALDTCPDLEPVRVQVKRLEKAIQGS